MFCQCERRRMKHRLRMARFTLVAIGLRRELRPMGIVVAALAGGRRQLVLRIRPGRLVTRRANQPLVFPLQRERTLLVVFDGVQRRLEAFFVMARAAIAACRPSGELTLMDVFVTIRAQRVRDFFAEVAIGMALEAAYVAMFTQQRELGPVVIEPRVRLQ